MLKTLKKKRLKNKIKNTKYLKVNRLNQEDMEREILEFRKENGSKNKT